MTLPVKTNSNHIKKIGDELVLFFIGVIVLLMVYAVFTGLLVMLAGHTYKTKNFKGCVLSLLALWAVHLALHPEGPRVGFEKFTDRVKKIGENKLTPLVLFAVSGFLFAWQQVTEYFPVGINFLPFSFYDYMLYYFFSGKIHYTSQPAISARPLRLVLLSPQFMGLKLCGFCSAAYCTAGKFCAIGL